MMAEKNDSIVVAIVLFVVIMAMLFCATDSAQLAPLTGVSILALPTPQSTPNYANLLKNASFERDWRERAPGVLTARNWMPFMDATFSEFGGAGFPDGWYRVLTGETAQKVFVVWNITNWAGIYQTVPCTECDTKTYVTPGALLFASANFQIWTGQWCPNTPGFWQCPYPKATCKPISFWRLPEPCAQTIDRDNMQARICIDPTGGIDPQASKLVCSDWTAGDDTYKQIQVWTTALTNTATVFVGYRNRYGLELNNFYVDDVRLVELWPRAYLPTIRRGERAGIYASWVRQGRTATLYLNGLRSTEVLQAVEARFTISPDLTVSVTTGADWSAWRVEGDQLIFEAESARWSGPLLQAHLSGVGCLRPLTAWAFFVGFDGGGALTPEMPEVCQ